MKYRFLSILFLYHVFLKCGHKFLSSISSIFLKVTQQANFFFFFNKPIFSNFKDAHLDSSSGPVKCALPLQKNTGSISHRGIKIPHVAQCRKKKKKHLKILAAYSFIEYGYLYMENYFYFSNQVVSVGACFAHYNKIV